MRPINLATIAALTLGAAVAGYAVPAFATISYVTITGTVVLPNAYGLANSTVDTTGAFGTAGASLIGDTYSAQLEFNTSLGIDYLANNANELETNLYGGSYWGVSNPLVAASLTINGRTVVIAGDYNTYVQQGNQVAGSNPQSPDYIESISSIQANSASGTDLSFTTITAEGKIPVSLTVPFSVATTDETFAAGEFRLGSTSTLLNLDPAMFSMSLTASDPLAVPEPASMALLAGAVVVFAAAAGICRTSANSQASVPSNLDFIQV